LPENIDSYGRRIDYLRISVTDRCNLRCFYCAPIRHMVVLPHEEILRFEEILAVVRAGVELGIRKIRLTGGEPLIRRGFTGLVRAIGAIAGIEDLAVTTNGVLLRQMAPALAEAGLRRINVSCDTLDPERFRQITQRDRHAEVLAGIHAAEEAGLAPIKINMVPIRGLNDDEVERFALLTFDKPYAVRFIEYMPIGKDSAWDPGRFVSIGEVKTRLESLHPLLPLSRGPLDGPSRRFKFPSARGEIGLIGAVSEHFCDTCNRLRLTADGKIRPCLLSDEEWDLKGLLRKGASQRDLVEALGNAVAHKPRRHHMENACADDGCLRSMWSIGG